jgi:ubiquinone/menaquinone biosynthesis C-methylase UbiE
MPSPRGNASAGYVLGPRWMSSSRKRKGFASKRQWVRKSAQASTCWLDSGRTPGRRTGLTDYYQRHGNYAAAAWHRRFLRNAYCRSYRTLHEMGCNPLGGPSARVLLCGAGAPATVLEFASFLHAQNPSAELLVADVAQPPLVASERALKAQQVLGDVTFVRADARALPFPAQSFDLVETDFLLQFLPPADRHASLREWARILRPGGGLMTRDWVTRGIGLDPLWDGLRRAVIRTVLGARTYVLTYTDLRTALEQAGFDAMIRRLSRLPLIHVIAGVVPPPHD